jgi:NitT/TauT family transport system substrate-binding protein
MYGSSSCDAVCVTNMDVLSPALGRPSVAILPTSTSEGADALIVTGIEDVEQLKEHKVYGLDNSVSHYCFVRNLQELGKDPGEYQFTNKDPAAAALAMQNGQDGFDAIIVWNPFVLETLKARDDAKVLFDSSNISGEIIDMVVVSHDALERPGGDAFACAVIDAFFQVVAMMENEKTRDETLTALGAKFSGLGLEEMKQVVEQTRFVTTPDAAKGLFEGEQLPSVMEKVTAFCLDRGIFENRPTMSYKAGESDGATDLLFDTTYLQKVMAEP